MTPLTRRELLRGAAAAGALGLEALAGCGPPAERRPNLLFLCCDQLRRDSLGFAEADPVTTPHCDALARSSCAFTRAYATSPLCMPARSALYTGRHPAATGIVDNSRQLYAELSREGLGYALRRLGYSTGYIGKYHLANEWVTKTRREHVPGWQRCGFEFWYANNLNHAHFVNLNGTGEDRVVVCYGWQPDHEVDVVIDFLRNESARFPELAGPKRDPARPFALFVNFGPPHNGVYNSRESYERVLARARREGRDPTFQDFYRDGENVPPGFLAPEAYRKRYEERYGEILAAMRERPNFGEIGPWAGHSGEALTRRMLVDYFGAVTAIDDAVQRVLDCLDEQGLAEDTIVVFTSDHGEMLGSHQRKQKHVYFEEAVAVPLLVRWPGRIAPRRTDAFFDLMDLLPTLLGLAGGEPPPGAPGVDFSPLLLGAPFSPPEQVYYCYAEFEPGRGTGHFEALRDGEQLYVEHFLRGRFESFVYDLRRDPHQLAPIHPDRANRARFGRYRHRP